MSGKRKSEPTISAAHEGKKPKNGTDEDTAMFSSPLGLIKEGTLQIF